MSQTPNKISRYSILGLGIGLLAIALCCLAIALVNANTFEPFFAHILLAGSIVLLICAAFLIVWAYTELGRRFGSARDSVLETAASREDCPGSDDQQEVVLRLKKRLEELQKAAAEREDELLQVRLAAIKHEGALADWQERALDMFASMERILTGEGMLNEDGRQAVRELLKRYKKLMEPLGVSPIIPEPGDPFDALVHSRHGLASDAEVPANHVVKCVSWGFMVNGKVHTTAEVVVAQGEDNDRIGETEW
ncbi:MAG: nucleotide exchange factor GrpE [Candidatus Wallacebacter cryptica]